MVGGAETPIMEEIEKRINRKHLVKRLMIVVAVCSFFFLPFYTAADQELLTRSYTSMHDELQSIFKNIIFTDEQIENQKLFIETSLQRGLDDKGIKDLFVVAYCESTWYHFSKDGSVLSGYVHSPDKGLFQINTKVHDSKWERPVDNINTAIDLYQFYGLQPWKASNKCLNKWL